MKRFIFVLALTSVLVGLHLCGGRGATSVLAGATPHASDAALGAAYVVTWIVFVLAAVPTLIVVGLARAAKRWKGVPAGPS